jgi:hypothetical protein
MSSIAASGVLFALVGTPLGAIVYLIIAGIAAGKPWMIFDALKDFGIVLMLAALFGGIPAGLTGIAAGVLRIRLRSLPMLLCAATPLGTLLSGLHAFVLFGFRDRSPIVEWIALTGGIAAFCCTLVLWRYPRWATFRA